MLTRTTKQVMISMPPKLAEAVRRKSEETGVPLSTAIQRLLAEWVITGELPPLRELPQDSTNKPKRVSKPKK